MRVSRFSPGVPAWVPHQVRNCKMDRKSYLSDHPVRPEAVDRMTRDWQWWRNTIKSPMGGESEMPHEMHTRLVIGLSARQYPKIWWAQPNEFGCLLVNFASKLMRWKFGLIANSQINQWFVTWVLSALTKERPACHFPYCRSSNDLWAAVWKQFCTGEQICTVESFGVSGRNFPWYRFVCRYKFVCVWTHY